MGTSHARAYRAIEGFELVGLCTSRAADRHDLEVEFPGLPRFERYDEALATLRPDAVAICTYTEHHAVMALQAFAISAHVFCEKPLADTLEAGRNVVRAAGASGKAPASANSVYSSGLSMARSIYPSITRPQSTR
jgi:predicted dehydrogenase